MQDLVDQTHGIYLSGSHSLFRKGNQVPASIDFLCEQANSVEIGENHITRQTEKYVIKLVQVPCTPGYVKFHSVWFEFVHISFCDRSIYRY
jgi:hypothetical protein